MEAREGKIEGERSGERDGWKKREREKDRCGDGRKEMKDVKKQQKGRET